MSNTNALFGFVPIGRDTGGPWGTSEYGKLAAHTQAIFRGDIVSKYASSVASPFGGAPVPTVTSLQNGTPGTTLWLGASVNYGAAATLTLHYVADEPDVVFIAQCDDTTSITVADHIGKDAAIVTGTGNSTTKRSTMGIDASTIAASASGCDLRLLRLHNRADNAEGAYAICEVLIIKHAKTQGSAGV